jgi:hypothetical protein
MIKEPGARVGAILSSDKETVWLLGYGVYDGDLTPDKPMGMHAMFGDTWEAWEADMRTELGDEWPADKPVPRPTNPRITLDNGDVVWGAECWWGDEEGVRKSIGTRRVVNVRISDARARAEAAKAAGGA